MDSCATCFLCKQCVAIKVLREHFQFSHGFDFEKSNCDRQFYCIENECNKDFSTFRGFRQHVIQFHVRASDAIQRNNSHDNNATENARNDNVEHSINHDEYNDWNSTTQLNSRHETSQATASGLVTQVKCF